MNGSRLRTVAGVVFGVAIAVALAWLSLLLFRGDDPTLVPPSTAPGTSAVSTPTTLA